MIKQTQKIKIMIIVKIKIAKMEIVIIIPREIIRIYLMILRTKKKIKKMK